VELERCFSIVVTVMRKDIEECSDEVEIFASDVRDLENWAYSLADELSSSLDRFFAVLDEDWDFASARRFQYSGKLSDCLL